MKAEERQMIETLLAPVSELQTLLAPLGELPDALRALARAVGGDALPQTVEAGHFDVARAVAELAGLDQVPGETLEDVVRRVIDDARAQAIEHARATNYAAPQEIADARLAGADLVRQQIWCAAGLDGDPPLRSEDFVSVLREASAREALDNARAEIARVAGIDVLDPTEGIASVVQRALEKARELGYADGVVEARAQVLGVLVERSGHPPVDVGVVIDVLADAIRDGLDAGASVREVRERAARSALLDLLDDVAPGVRQERPSGAAGAKLEDYPARELRAEIAARLKQHIDVVSGSQSYEADVLAATLGRQAQDELPVQRAQLRQAMDLAARALISLDAEPRKGATIADLVEELARLAGKPWGAGALAAIADALDVPRYVEGSSLQGWLDVTLAAIRERSAEVREVEATTDLDALATARDTIAQLDGILRPVVAAAGVPVEDATILDLAERIVLIASQAANLPRSARDGARREQRELATALGLQVQIDHLSVPGARAALVRAIQAQTANPDEPIVQQFQEICRILHDSLPDASEFTSSVELAREVAERARVAISAVEGPKTAVLREIATIARALGTNDAIAHMNTTAARSTLIRDIEALIEREVAKARDAAQAAAPLDLDALYKSPIETVVRKDDGAIHRVWSACKALGVELTETTTVHDACDDLGSRIDALETWVRDWLSPARLWDRALVDNCPLDVPAFDQERGTEDLDDVSEDDLEWRDFARRVKAVAEGDDVVDLAAWIPEKDDVRVVLQAMLDRVTHLEEQLEEQTEQESGRVDTGSPYAEELARRIFELWPASVDVATLRQIVRPLDDVDDPQVNGVRALLSGKLDRADVRDLEAWVALDPATRNRLIDRTRDALAAVG